MKSITSNSNSSGASFNIYRKLWHLLGLVIPLSLFFNIFFWFKEYMVYPTRSVGLVIIVFLTILMIVVDLLRFKSQKFRSYFMFVFEKLLKRNEKEGFQFQGTIPFFIAIILLFLFFSKDIIFLSCLFLMLGDTSAAYIGIRFGRFRFKNNKTLEGLVAFIVVSFIAGLIYLIICTYFDTGYFSLRQSAVASIITVFIGVIISAFTEFFSMNRLMGFVDDNLWVPLTGAVGLAAAGYLFFGFPADSVFFDPRKLF